MSYENEEYRDRLSTVDKEGKRIWVYPKKPSGRLHTYRSVLAVFLLAFLFGAPFLHIDGEPFMLFNLLERKFILFGMVFWPQDSYLFFLAMLSVMVFVVLFTTVYGRMFCGWICPQTIFMEMVFRKIEYAIEGDAPQQRKLDKQPMNFEKFWKKGLKHGLFFLISILIANTFLAWIIGTEELSQIITDPIDQHASGFTAMVLFSFAFYFVFAKFREQVCIVVCPYGRLQGVLLDPDSVVVAYDYKRGEPRAGFKRNENRAEANKGDCVECKACVQVCPTNIDIRNGTQLECINCTACIDACDTVMEKHNLPKGLIRFASKNQIEQGDDKLAFTTRTKAYVAVFTVIFASLIYLMTNRADVEATLFRTQNQLFQELPDGSVSNIYNIKIINKTRDTKQLDLRLLSHEGEIRLVTGDLTVEPKGATERVLFVVLPKEALDGSYTKLEFGLYEGEQLLDTYEGAFQGPEKPLDP